LQALHVLTSTTEYDIVSWQDASVSILNGTADEKYGGSRTAFKESVHSASEQCSNDALPSVSGFVVQRDFMTGATKEVDTDWMSSSEFGATKDGDAEGMQPEDSTCMARGHMGAAHAAALDELVIFLTTHYAMPFTPQRLPGSVEGEITSHRASHGKACSTSIPKAVVAGTADRTMRCPMVISPSTLPGNLCGVKGIA
jgi:hypothetical protein